MSGISNTNNSQQQQVERLISNRELFASMTLEPYNEKEEAEKAKQKISNAQAKKEYEERERQNINTRHIIHCMKRALFRSLSLREMREALRPLDPATDFDMMTKVNFDGVHTRHDAPVLGGMCCSTVVTREDEIEDQRAELEGDGMRLPAYLRRGTTTTASNEPINVNNNNMNGGDNRGNKNNNKNGTKIGGLDGKLKSSTMPAAATETRSPSAKKISDKKQLTTSANNNNSNTKKPVMIAVDESEYDFNNTDNNNSHGLSGTLDSTSKFHMNKNNNNQNGKNLVNRPSSALDSNKISSHHHHHRSHQPSSRSHHGHHSSGGGGFSSFFGSSSNHRHNSNNDSDNYTDSDDDSSSDDTDYDLEVSATLPPHYYGSGGVSTTASPSSGISAAQRDVDNPAGINTDHVDPTKNIQFQFTDFAPMCYRHIRHFFGIEPENFLKVLVESNWHSIPTPGKSSAQLYFCGQNWVIKTMTAGESDFLSRVLHRYYYHVRDNPHTLLPHFVGHHRLKFKDVDGSDMEFTFVIMQNVFATPLKIHTKFDLKGSTVGRFATAEEKKKTTCTQKDLDVNRPLRLGEQRKNLLLEQLRRDCDFLRRSEIMDYSFLVGVHDMSKGYPVWHNVSSSSTGGTNGVFGDFNSNDFNASLDRQQQQQQQRQGFINKNNTNSRQNNNNTNNVAMNGTTTTKSPNSPPPLLSVTNASLSLTTSQKIDPISGMDPGQNSSRVLGGGGGNGTLASSTASASQQQQQTTSIGNNNNNTSTSTTGELGTSSALSLTGSYLNNNTNNTNNNITTSSPNNATPSTNIVTGTGENFSQRRRRAQSGIHNHPHLQPYQQLNNNNNNNNTSNISSVTPTMTATATGAHAGNSSHQNHVDPMTGMTLTPSSVCGGDGNTLSSQFPSASSAAPAESLQMQQRNNNSNNNNYSSRQTATTGSLDLGNQHQQHQYHQRQHSSSILGGGDHHHHQIQQQQQQHQQQQISSWLSDERCFTADSGGMMSLRRDEIYYLGVIDILQEYNWWKKAETVIMGTIHDKEHISSVDPRTYATRFIDFMESIII